MTITIVVIGRASDRSASAGSSQSSRGKPPEGRTPSPSANTQTSTTPTQNTGTATPSCANPESTMPYQRSDFTAAVMPITRETSRAIVNERSVSGIVTARRSAMSGPTGRELRNDSPRSKRSSCPAHVVNC
ncbi:MAG: hypothetical protein K0R99_961 [Microbacterium sp.]|nr:hypothetical protein [Microbacterium sp.]